MFLNFKIKVQKIFMVFGICIFERFPCIMYQSEETRTDPNKSDVSVTEHIVSRSGLPRNAFALTGFLQKTIINQSAEFPINNSSFRSKNLKRSSNSVSPFMNQSSQLSVEKPTRQN